MIPQFLDDGPYAQADGHIAPYQRFCKLFAQWLNDPAMQLAFLQKNNRVAIALEALGYSVGPLPCHRGRPSDDNGGLWIGNMQGPGSRTICNRPVVLEDGCLQPADMSTAEQKTLEKYHREVTA